MKLHTSKNGVGWYTQYHQKKKRKLKILLYMLLLPLGIMAQTQIGQDIDGEAEFDQFGRSVCISADGSIVAVGADGNDGNGLSSGHVRIYKNNAGTWEQLGQDIDGEAEWDYSGRSVSLSDDGSIVAIGALYNDDNGNASGHVRVYQYNGTNWQQLGQDIDGEAETDYSGASVSLSADGSIVAIGAYGNDENGTSSGHVRVYRYVNSNWTKFGNDIDGEAKSDQFGESVSISDDGSILAVGAKSNDSNGLNSGHVRVYQYDGSDWIKLGDDIEGDSAGSSFGYAVSLNADGSIVAIGARFDSGNGNRSGQVKVLKYDQDNNAW